ncbi:hypothetical protein [Nocardia transvalensis]|uniref:hypothetical protein n=1 Tax=Nocardia transvalensis TaxID=37333 RepID=UPI001892EB62|nr:hypothetical protein [Nocardia transvalensis]MBF6328165.1 hypothetical protein [Nocardia transvalensis]
MMTVHSQAVPVPPREDDELADDAVVWPDPSPLSSWWQQIMQTPAERPVPPVI